MNDLELAEEIEHRLEAIPEDYFWSISFPFEEWDQIIAALRRGADAIYIPLLYACEHALLSTAASRAVNDQLLKDIRSALAPVESATTGGGQSLRKTDSQESPADERLTVAAGPERPPSGEMVMVPREIGELAQDMVATMERQPGYKLAITHGRILRIAKEICRLYERSKLSAAEAEGRKPYAHIMGACPLCGRTDSHSHTSGPLGMS